MKAGTHRWWVPALLRPAIVAATKGDPLVGLMARVKGSLQPDGTVLAMSIRVGAEQAELEGPIESVSDTAWNVGGRTVHITPDTKIDGEPKVGRTAQVKGSLLSNGSLNAFEVVMKGTKYKLPKLDFQGPIQVIGGASWKVGDRTVVISPQAKITGEPRVGSVAKVRGVIQPDGAVVALKIKVAGTNKTQRAEQPEDAEEPEEPEEPEETP